MKSLAIVFALLMFDSSGDPSDWKTANDHDCGFADVEPIEGSKLEYKVFPNPVNGELTIALYSDEISQVMITDLMGNVVFNGQLLADESTQITTSNWSNGIYSVVFIKEDGTIAMEKIVVANV